jgi:hypothetical protein
MAHASASPTPEERARVSEADQVTAEAVGTLSEALETIEVARGHLYAFHKLTGTADFGVENAIGLLRKAGHDDFADRLSRELLGRNVLPGRWTYQVVEDYEETYYEPFRELERQGRELVHGMRHVHEASLKTRRRTPGEEGHEAIPAESAGTGPRPDPAG